MHLLGYRQSKSDLLSDSRVEANRRAAVESMLSRVKDEYTGGPGGGSTGWDYGLSQVIERTTRDGAKGARLNVGDCAHPGCKQSWATRWRTKKRAVFEGRSACRGACMRSLVRAAIQREGGERRSRMVSAPHRHRVPLGLVMLAQGWITNPQLQAALASQRASGTGRIGEWLVSECGLDRESVTRGLSAQWNCPVLTSDGFQPESMAMILPRSFVEEYGLLPLRIAGSQLLYLGFKDHLDVSAAYAIERMTELQIERGVVEEHEFKAEQARLLECRFPAVESAVASSMEALVERVAELVEEAMAPRVKLVRLHEHYWLRVWKQSAGKVAAGAVPSDVDDVLDYLFTIGSEHS